MRVEGGALEVVAVAAADVLVAAGLEVLVEAVEVVATADVAVTATDTVFVEPEPHAHRSPVHRAVARAGVMRRPVIAAQDIRRGRGSSWADLAGSWVDWVGTPLATGPGGDTRPAGLSCPGPAG